MNLIIYLTFFCQFELYRHCAEYLKLANAKKKAQKKFIETRRVAARPIRTEATGTSWRRLRRRRRRWAGAAPALKGGLSHRYLVPNRSIAKWNSARPKGSPLRILLVADPTANLPGAMREADALASTSLAPPPLPTLVDAGAAGAGAAVAGAAIAGAPPPLPVPGTSARDAEIDSTVLKYAILAAGLELLPQTMATMAIVPLQMKMVHGVGKSCGVSLDRGSIKEMLGVVGVGAASQVVESFARELVGGLAKKFLGKKAAKVAGVATGAAMTFATTWALGMVAKQYYAGGRRLSSIDLRSLFSRELERAKSLYPAHQGAIERSARETDLSSLLSVVRG